MAFSLNQRLVVLTGAASGIGAALALELSNRGADVALVDKDAAGLDTSAEKVRRNGGRVESYALDLADRTAIQSLPSVVSQNLGPASVLINNAGIALVGTFDQVSSDHFDHLFAINFFATVAMTRSFLPQLRQHRPAQIVNLSSVFGIVGVPGQTAYCASKFAVRGFSEALRAELLPEDIGVSLVHPGGVRTEIAVSALKRAGLDAQQIAALRPTADKPLRMDPRAAALRIVQGLERREKRIVVGGDARALVWLQRLMPLSYDRVLASRMRDWNQTQGSLPGRR